MSQLRGKRDEGHEKSERNNRLDPTLGVRNTDTGITNLVRDSRLYVTMRNSKHREIRFKRRVKLGMDWESNQSLRLADLPRASKNITLLLAA